jgi:hypothetical protein
VGRRKNPRRRRPWTTKLIFCYSWRLYCWR